MFKIKDLFYLKIDSFLKRVERYYCRLSNSQLIMYKRENDQRPYKGIQLKGTKK